MATRFYLRATAGGNLIAPTPDAAWEDTSILARTFTNTGKSSDPLTTVSFSDSNAADRDVLFRQYISAPLNGGQTITGAQAMKAQCLVQENNALGNMFFALGIRIIAANGSTVQKTVLAVTRDGTKAVAALTNRQFTATSAATNYTTVAGDFVVIEAGMAGDPGTGGNHSSGMRLGDNNASDLAENDTDTADANAWVELADTLTFTEEEALAQSRQMMSL